MRIIFYSLSLFDGIAAMTMIEVYTSKINPKNGIYFAN